RFPCHKPDSQPPRRSLSSRMHSLRLLGILAEFFAAWLCARARGAQITDNLSSARNRKSKRELDARRFHKENSNAQDDADCGCPRSVFLGGDGSIDRDKGPSHHGSRSPE